MDNILKTFAQQRPILIQTVKEFTDLIPDNPEMLDYIKRHIDSLEYLGKGEVGQIYLVSGETILKEVHICEKSTNKMCKLLEEGSVILTIPANSNGIGIHIMPNYLSEFYVGLLLAELGEQYGLFPKIYGQILDKSSPTKTMYILMEKLTPLEINFNTTRYIIDMIVILISIHHAQRFLRFTHYDLHWGNVMKKYRERSDVTFHICTEQNKLAITLPNMDYLPYIIDFGESTISATKPTGRVDILPRVYKSEFIDVPVFDPYFDPLTLLGNLINKLCIMLKIKTFEQYTIYFTANANYLDGLDNLIHCFFDRSLKLYDIFNNYYYFIKFDNFQEVYKPNIRNIHRDSRNKLVVFTPYDIILNLIRISSDLGIVFKPLADKCHDRNDQDPTRIPPKELFNVI